MERLALLRGEGQQDDQVLETDVMRFMALIGIVFWIIFALIKSIPFQAMEPDSPINKPIGKKEMHRVIARTESAQPVKKEETGKRETQDMHPQEPAEPTETPDKEARKPTSPSLRGVQMQFYTLDDLLILMETQRVRLFCRAQATGFDIFFEGAPQGKTVVFKGSNSLPASLWEIKSGKHYTFFLDLLAETYPAVRSFPTKQVLVSFTDEELESRVEQTLDRLDTEGKNGILSITRTGDVVFQVSGSRDRVSGVRNE